MSLRNTARAQAGFTLVELLVAITIAAILIGIAVPSYRDATLNSRLAAISNQLTATARLARSEAFKRNASITLCASDDGSSCSGTTTWHTGWVLRLGNGTVLAAQGAAPSGFRVNASTGAFLFNPRGFGTTSGSFTICRKTPSVGSQQRVVTVDTTGRTWLAKSSTTTCS
jgi:type IV fimbrial biogenesis protein FimT